MHNYLVSNIALATESNMTAKQGLAEAKRYYSEVEKAENILYSLLKQSRFNEIGSQVEAPMYALQQSWKDDYAMWPFTKCDTASRDLNILAGTYKMRLSEEIIQGEIKDYARSKSACTDAIQKPISQIEKEIAKEKLEVSCVHKQILNEAGDFIPDPDWKKPKFCP